MKLLSRFKVKENVLLILKDRDGKNVDLFQPNTFGTVFFRRYGFVPQTDFFGKFTPYLQVSNIITDVGRAAIAAKIGGVGVIADFEYMALGTDNTPATVGDTALGAEITTLGGARALANAAVTTTDVANDTLQLDHEWTFTGNLAINEIGIFNASSGPTMLSRIVLPAGTINVSNGMKLHAYWRGDID